MVKWFVMPFSRLDHNGSIPDWKKYFLYDFLGKTISSLVIGTSMLGIQPTFSLLLRQLSGEGGIDIDNLVSGRLLVKVLSSGYSLECLRLSLRVTRGGF